MDELNRQFLKNAIGQLPVHKAADYIWEEVRWGLDKPLSAELPVHPAPENAWSLLMSAAREESGNRYFLPIVSIFFAILFISTPLVPLVDKSFNPNPQTAGNLNKNNDYLPVSIQSTSIPYNHNPASTPSTVLVALHPVPVSGPDTKQESQVVTESSKERLVRNSLSALVLPGLLKNPFLLHSKPAVPDFRKPGRKTDGCSPFHKPEASLFLLANYEPLVFDSPELSSPVHAYTLNAGIEFSRIRLSLGAGYLQLGSHSLANYAYRTNELIYSYDYVDSVYIDPVTHQTYYFTVKVDIYDSIDHMATEDVHDRFSFLKIPFNLSYELANFRNFSLHLEAVAAYHLLQSDHRSFKPFNEVSSRLVSTTIEAKKINSGFWSAGGGITFAYKAGRALELQLTPRFGYNFISIDGLKRRPESAYSLVFGVLYKLNAAP